MVSIFFALLGSIAQEQGITLTPVSVAAMFYDETSLQCVEIPDCDLPKNKACPNVVRSNPHGKLFMFLPMALPDPGMYELTIKVNLPAGVPEATFMWELMPGDHSVPYLARRMIWPAKGYDFPEKIVRDGDVMRFGVAKAFPEAQLGIWVDDFVSIEVSQPRLIHEPTP